MVHEVSTAHLHRCIQLIHAGLSYVHLGMQGCPPCPMCTHTGLSRVPPIGPHAWLYRTHPMGMHTRLYCMHPWACARGFPAHEPCCAQGVSHMHLWACAREAVPCTIVVHAPLGLLLMSSCACTGACMRSASRPLGLHRSSTLCPLGVHPRLGPLTQQGM